MGYYWPEGMLLETEENRYYLQNEETLQSAMRIGQILEGRALLCDYDHNLVVDMGCCRGIIPREEGALGIKEQTVRDIAIISTPVHLPLFEDVDLIQVGARNMQNFELLKAVGRTNIPVLLKRGLSATLEELVMSAEYIMAEGNPNVVLCERGIRTFETSMRNTLDISAVPMLKKMTHLPVVIDPSHAAGIAFMVPSLAKAAVAFGADGLMIEVHNDPARAKSDGAQSLTPDQFDDLMATIRPELEFFGKTLN